MSDSIELSSHASTNPDQPAALPLVIDLDGGLLPVDLTAETILDQLLSSFSFGRLAKLALRREFDGSSSTRDVRPDCAALPYDAAVLERAREARIEGRPVYLLTVQCEATALAVARHLGLFKGVIASTVTRPLTEAAKADALLDAFGAKRFEYVGGSKSDRYIWSLASRTILVGVARRLQGDLTAAHANVSFLDSRPGAGNGWFQALRVHQWAKNSLVFVPLITSHHFTLIAGLQSLTVFLAFSICASAVYLLNDLVDRRADRAHPRKQFRPIASGRLAPQAALAMIPVLLLAAAAIGSLDGLAFSCVLLAYLVLTTAYSLHFKKLLLVDIVVLAGLYTLRIVAGAVAIDVVLSEWLLIFSIFIFTALALIKRYTELAMREDAELADPKSRDYSVGDMGVVCALAAASGMNAVIVISLYFSSAAVAGLYHRPALLWLLDPLLLYWIARALMLAHRRQMHDDPVVFAFRDGPSRITGVLMIGIVLAAM